eukprot:UN29996
MCRCGVLTVCILLCSSCKDIAKYSEHCPTKCEFNNWKCEWYDAIVKNCGNPPDNLQTIDAYYACCSCGGGQQVEHWTSNEPLPINRLRLFKRNDTVALLGSDYRQNDYF